MTVRRLGIAAALAVPAGVAAVLAPNAARTCGTPAAALLVAPDAVWVAQGVPAVIRHRRSR